MERLLVGYIYMLVKFKLLYLLGVGVNILTMNIIKYLGVNGILSVVEIIFLRTLVATCVLLPFNLKELKTVPKQNSKTLLCLLGLGILASVDAYMWNIGIQTVPLNNAMILLFISPVITAIMSTIILREKMTINITLKFGINIIAVLLVYHFSLGGFTIGYLYLMSDFIVYGLIAILIKKLNTFSANFLVFIRFLFLLPISALLLKHIPIINAQVVVFILFIVFGYITQRTLITLAFKNIPIVEIQPLRYVNIVFSSLFSYMILGEKLTIYQIVCSIMIVFGGILVDRIIRYLQHR